MVAPQLLNHPVGDRTQRRFSPRNSLPLASNYLWRIDSGVARSLTWLEDGTVVALGVWGKGDLVGKALSKTDPLQIECLTRVEATPVPATADEQTVAALLKHLQQAEDLLMIRSHKRTEQTLVRLLNWLAKRFGHEVENGQLIDLRLTHQDIAELLGTTRVTITRMLTQLEQQNLIQRLPMHRIVLHEDELWHYEI